MRNELQENITLHIDPNLTIQVNNAILYYAGLYIGANVKITLVYNTRVNDIRTTFSQTG